jgi:hypothetical protein
MPDEQKTAQWSDIEAAALNDPYLHMAVTAVRHGTATREEALTAVALALSRERAARVDELVQMHMRCICGATDAVIAKRPAIGQPTTPQG